MNSFVTGPTQCQDGITNNCTQECTRDADTGVYNCSCYSDLGYQINPDNDTLCIGTQAGNNTMQRKIPIVLACPSSSMPITSLPHWTCTYYSV